MTIRPRHKQVLVEPIEEDLKTMENGLIIPSNVEQEQKSIGTVLAIGQGIDDIKVDDKVIYGKFAGEQISITKSDKDIDYVILFDEDVLALVDDYEV